MCDRESVHKFNSLLGAWGYMRDTMMSRCELTQAGQSRVVLSVMFGKYSPVECAVIGDGWCECVAMPGCVRKALTRCAGWVYRWLSV